MAFQLNVTVLPAIADAVSTEMDGIELFATTGGADVVPPGIVIFSELVVPFLFGQES